MFYKHYVSAVILTLGMGSLNAQSSNWAKLVNGKLTYETTAKGDHIMDFSYAGYNGGGVALPTGINVAATVHPSGGDDTQAIQNAINSVSSLSQGSNKFRGEVLLASGTFHISKTITIQQTGVVLSGSGSGSTTVEMTGSTGFLAFQMGVDATPSMSNTVNLTSSYVPSGSLSVGVSSVSNFSVGDTIVISRPVTSTWVHYLGMDDLVRNGVHQTWIAVGSSITTERTIAAINSSTKAITLTAPITDSFDSAYLGSPVGTLSAYSASGRILRVGLQGMKIVAPQGTTIYPAVDVQNVLNGWLQDVIGQETQNGFVIEKSVRQFTLDHVTVNISVVQTSEAPTGDFQLTGSEIFVNKCASNGSGDWPIVTQSEGTGPIAVLNFSSTQDHGITPHQRWTTGLLVDNATLPNAPSGFPGLAYTNRGTDGSGHGWTTGWSVAWNITTPDFTVSAAPGTENWCIGCKGHEVSKGDDGIYNSTGTKVTPSSLYLEQLKERLGQSALDAIGYSDYQP